MKILGVIPARGGSKGVPRKNIRPLLGKSLIQWTFEEAIKCPSLDRIVLSTDDDEIARHGKEIGLEVPFLRPEHLAADTTPMIDVLTDLLDRLETENYFPDALLLLQPTSPLRTARHIETAVEMLGDNDSVCTVFPLPLDICPHFVMKVDENGYLDFFLPEGKNIKRRQDVIPAYKRAGLVYLCRTSVIRKYNDLYGEKCKPYIVDRETAVSIDTWDDWQAAEKLLLSKTTQQVNP
ncbi:MAG: acylneuraminate cytidylyltransferase family protein [Bacteroidia bacterium]|nr:acylneuraminate cytidylyltransferase family protein [Bacteroidia bacterium]